MMRVRTYIKNKLNSKAGFTLTEMLATVIIMLMVSAIVAAGVPVAREAYEKVVLKSNAEVLLSSTISALRNELGTAKDVEVNTSTKVIRYYNLTRGAESELSVDADQGIMFQRYISDVTYPKVRLMSSVTATGDMYVTYGSVSWSDDGYITFGDLSVNMDGRTGLATRGSLSIRVISY